MQQQLAQARKLLRDKQADLSLLDQQLQHELSTQQLLQQILAQQGASLSSSQLSKGSSDDSESSQSSISSAWLLAQVQRANQFVNNCMQARYAQPWPVKRAQFPIQSRSKYSYDPRQSRNFHQLQQAKKLEESSAFNKSQQSLHSQQHSHKKPSYFKQIAVNNLQETHPNNIYIPSSLQSIQKMPFKKPLQQNIREQLLRQQREAIRRAIIQQQQTAKKEEQHTKKLTTQLHKQYQLSSSIDYVQPNDFRLSSSKFQGLESLKRRSAMKRVVAEIKRAKDKGSQIQQLIAKQSALVRF